MPRQQKPLPGKQPSTPQPASPVPPPLGSVSHPADASPTVDAPVEVAALRALVEETRRELNLRLDALAAAVETLGATGERGAVAPSHAPSPSPRPAATAGAARRAPRHGYRVGDEVYVPRLGGSYEVVDAPADSRTFKVQAGAIRVELSYEEVWPLDGAVAQAAEAERLQRADETPAPAVVAMAPVRGGFNPQIPELDLHGQSERQAMATLELFLHHSYTRHATRVRIIHGKGDGILRAAVRRDLERSALVRSIETGAHLRGDDGVTIANLEA